MLKYTLLYCAIIFLTHLVPNFTNDFYSKFHQRDYKIEFQRVQLLDYNKSIYNILTMKTFKYNRTQPVVNFTVNSKVNMSNELEMRIQAYKFLSNKYRKHPGTNFQINWCKSLSSNILGLQITTGCGNLTSCEVVQDTTYIICNFYPDESQFPPFTPTGDYQSQVDFIYRDIVSSTIEVYFKIYRPIPIPKRRKTVY